VRFTFAPEHRDFRDEVREFIATNVQESRELDAPAGEDPSSISWSPTFSKRLRDKGWLGLPLPPEYGGAGKDPMYQAIFNEEMAYHRAPLMAHWRGVYYVAPVLIRFGTEEQKSRLLPRILGCEMFFCTGFSEPQAGSDLASLQTRAIRDGDNYVINGQKIWTSDAHHAGWAWLAARTAPDLPKHKGISNFALDLSLPGVEVRPLKNMNDEHHFNEVFFTDVVVPSSALIGEENRGWYQTATSLDFERSSIANFASSQRMLDDLLPHLAAGNPKLTPLQRNTFAELYVRLGVGQMMSYNVAYMQSQGIVPNKEASIAKLMSSEIRQDVGRLVMDMYGLSAQLLERFPGEAEMVPAHNYISGTTATIAGGTSEVQRGIIATRGVGMPRA
jgi:3-oxocholest-4-en-26-oyl-CoA dehydrogenase alpha subunit